MLQVESSRFPEFQKNRQSNFWGKKYLTRVGFMFMSRPARTTGLIGDRVEGLGGQKLSFASLLSGGWYTGRGGELYLRY